MMAHFSCRDTSVRDLCAQRCPTDARAYGEKNGTSLTSVPGCRWLLSGPCLISEEPTEPSVSHTSTQAEDTTTVRGAHPTNQQRCLTPCSRCASWDSSPSPPPATSRTVPGGGSERCRTLASDSACPVAPETGAAASAPVSAAGRVWAACWALQRQLTVWRRTTCSPPARQEGDPVDLREDTVQHQDSAVTQRAVQLTLTAWQRQRPQIRATAPQGASLRSCCSACCM